MDYNKKNLKRTKDLMVAFMLIFCLNISSGQYSEFGIGGGAMTYWGDLNTPTFSTNVTKNSGFAVQLTYRKFFKNYFAIRASVATGKVQGADKHSTLEYQLERNIDFFSNISEVSLMGELFFFGFNTEPGSSIFSPYISLGVSAFRFNPKTYYQGEEIRLQPLGTEGQGIPGFGNKYSLTSIAMPIGGGAKVFLNEKINLGAEIIMRWATTDYLDDISGDYVTYDDLRAGNGALAAKLGNRMDEYLGLDEPVVVPTGSQRGGADANDIYFVSTVSVNVILDSQGRGKGGRRKNKVICPKF